MQQKNERFPSFFRSFMTGAVAGSTSVIANHPFWTIKTRQQMGLPFSYAPRTLYTGVMVNAGSMMPITAIRFGLNSLFANHLPPHSTFHPYLNLTMSSFLSGASSAVIAGPVEMVITHQGKTHSTFRHTYRNLVQHRGHHALLSGMPLTAVRDGIYLSFFFTAPIILKNINQETISPNSLSFSLIANFLSGLGAVLTTQPFDTVKTLQQASPGSITAWHASKQLYEAQGFKGFYLGTTARGCRLIVGMMAMREATEKIDEALDDTNQPPMPSI